MRVVICGGGVIGACTAYFLSRKGIEAIVVERERVACAASGKAGGFLALDWCDGSPLEALARRSFALHAELAARHGDRWGYRRLDALDVVAAGRGRHAHGPDWLGAGAFIRRRLSTAATTAQVHPGRFTEGMMEAAIERGAELRRGCVTGVTLAPDRAAATGVVVDGAPLEADAVVIAMGPWSALAGRWLPLPAVTGLKGNSLVLKTEPASVPSALFAEVEGEDGALHTPELFPRPDGTTYICGLSGAVPLPDDPAEVSLDPGADAALRAIARRLAPALGDAPILAAQACFRPMTRDGLPLLGRIAGMSNAYVATGHSVWGILNGPASGEAMAELIADGMPRHVDLAPFDPARLPPMRVRAV